MGYIKNNSNNSCSRAKGYSSQSGSIFKQSVLVLLALAMVLMNGASADAITSRINTRNFTSAYSAEWYTIDNQDGSDIILHMTLRIKSVSYRDWTIGNNDGIWVGVGFGNTVMQGTDIVMCTFRFSGVNSND